MLNEQSYLHFFYCICVESLRQLTDSCQLITALPAIRAEIGSWEAQRIAIDQVRINVLKKKKKNMKNHVALKQ